MSLANKPVNPTMIEVMDGLGDMRDVRSPGMTLREHFAGLAMQGLFSVPAANGVCSDHARAAVQFADALIAELERTS